MIYLKELSFFRKFPLDLVEKIQANAKVMKFTKGDIILEQGQPNNALYFLLKGHLDVYVDGGRVAQLTKEGDLIGEMSLISEQNSSATIQADGKVEVLKIDGPSMHKLAEEGESGVEILYKVYSDILIQKLEATNHRAKKTEAYAKELEVAQDRLEAANASLELKVKDRTAKIAQNLEELKQKNIELQASHDKITDLYQSRDITFQSLDNLLNKNLVPLRQGIQDFKKDHNIQGQSIQSVEKEVARAIRMLEPLTKSFIAEKSMSSKKVLLAEPIKKQHSAAKMALGGTGVELEIVQTVDEAKAALENRVYDIFMFSEDFLCLTDFAKTKNPDLDFVFVTSKDIPDYVNTLLSHSFVPNVVNRDEEDKQFTIKNYVTTVSKLASGNYFGLEKYISWGVEVKEIEVESSDQRAQIIEEMDEHFEKSGVRSTNRGRVTVVAEELLMNAIYDAPRNDQGEPLYNHKDRRETVSLAEAHRPIFRFATDGVLMAISIEDPFGGLDATTLFRYLEKCYTSAGSLNDGRSDKGGGGRGLHQIIENSDLVVFNVDTGRRTEVIALFNADMKTAIDRNPNLHFFKAAA
jgi:CRP-like cAMP-binding protein